MIFYTENTEYYMNKLNLFRLGGDSANTQIVIINPEFIKFEFDTLWVDLQRIKTIKLVNRSFL